MDVAEVRIWGELAGAVAWDDAAGLATFEYDPRFTAKGWDLAPLQMPISASTKTFVFPELRKKAEPELDSFKGLPGLLADVLPDRYGNELINLWLARQGRPQNSMNPVEMLCFIGTRGMGALEFEPPVWKARKRTFSIEIETLVDVAKNMLSKKEAFATNLDADTNKAVSELFRIGTSAGGARPKAVVAYNEKTGEVRSGQTNAPKGFEHWLLKLDGVSDVQLGTTHGYGRVEMAYYNMALACGIIMMPSRLLEENERAHFMTKRFDREGGSAKHHIQTFSALKHFDYNSVMSFSYEQLFQTMRELKLPYPDAEQMFRRMVFNVAARNCDDHTKNFSFRLKRDARWELAPAYDVCHAYQPNHRWVSQHALSINTKRTNITKKDLLTIAKSINVKTAVEIIDEIDATVAQWKKYADEVAVPPSLRDQIADTLIHVR
ncbi:type II toxin-antitoxin system HipA family toxin [Prosthecochloris sp. SCSIO W1101]|uniref:type II toxin-antitoxin system HipA family toxin n=1 Tax=Prosthecochloris sp. SCSIO W1101 TaxID=2992242 RepID=UPI00223D4292|nr:type II toxin-antitoxin system HipA family toxin [Prosthecochloris sp. SCSIO W1101]UZJ40602.1 type II toxin-antitoxin system HipA family toxin [Prosthecochloris sp. SCSIO W1101]